MKKLLLIAVSATALLTQPVLACSYNNQTPVKMLSAGFEAWKVVTSAMEKCGNFTAELDQEFRKKQPTAFNADPAQYQLGGVANSTLVPLLNDGSIRPLDGYVGKYGQSLLPTQLIKKDGKVMAVAMMINAQHLMYRKDILADLNIPTPATYAEVLSAAEKIKNAGVVQYPLGGTYQTGWNLAQEFVNMYLGLADTLINSDNMPAVNNANGVRALQIMKSLSAYMDPEFLVSDSTYVQQQFQQGKIAMANLWASRAGAMDNVEESQVVDLVEFAAAPAAKPGGKPATTLWWDGMVIAKNASDEEADAAFQLIMQGLSDDVLLANKDAAIWLSDAFEPSRIAAGTIASAQGGAPSYPSSTAMGLMQTALGNNIADYLTGKEAAEQTLADIEAEYLTAAKEAGLL
ncbi:MAG: ABC transporter substrate-binding protein [Gammaproteobacteria bacterium]